MCTKINCPMQYDKISPNCDEPTCPFHTTNFDNSMFLLLNFALLNDESREQIIKIVDAVRPALTPEFIMEEMYGYWRCPSCGESLSLHHPNYCENCGAKLDWSKEK